MKSSMFVASAILVCVAGQANAACGDLSDTQVTDAALTTLLSGNMICGSRGGETWQEEHIAASPGVSTTGDLWDYKEGPGDATDPEEKLGTWTITGSGTGSQVEYAYDSGGTYTFKVFLNTGGSYDFCSATASENLNNTWQNSGVNHACSPLPVP
jgi:hypothetical protein